MASRVIGQGRFLRLVEDEGWEYTERVNSSGVVVIVPVTGSGDIVLVEQYRAPLRKRVLELPAGLVGDKKDFKDEAFEIAAARELEEETGFKAAKIEFLCAGPSASGSSNTLIHFYMATGLVQTGPGGGDQDENIEVHVVPLKDVVRFAAEKERQGRLVDSKLFAGLYFALHP